MIRGVAAGGFLSLRYLCHNHPRERGVPVPGSWMRKPRLDLINWLYRMTQLVMGKVALEPEAVPPRGYRDPPPHAPQGLEQNKLLYHVAAV